MKNINRFLKKNFLWIIFIGFAIIAILNRKDSSVFISEGSYSLGKYIIWGLFFSFLGYSIYCGNNEHFFKSVKRINGMLWGRQIGLDLYIGLLLPMVIIYLHSGSMMFLVYLIPILFYANIFTLLYFALNYDSLVNHFVI